MRVEISNPERILRLLDSKLSRPMELVIYGRAALALGFVPPNKKHCATKDVDAVIPARSAEAFVRNQDFWDAQDAVNKELDSERLYITHIFSEEDVIIRPGWSDQKVAIPLSFQNLRIYRPCTLDLILTKMMRDDPEDLADIEFLLACEPAVSEQVPAGLAEARVPNIPELVEQFERMKPKVMEMVRRFLSPNRP